jgi:hypothetical protein
LSFGGGESGFRRIHSHLQAFLEGLPAEVREEVADLFRAARDDLSRWRLVDRVGDSAEHRLHRLPHRLDELIARQLGLGGHGKGPREGKGLAYLD